MVIIKLKANLSSTSHLTSQLELSLAKTKATFSIQTHQDLQEKKNSANFFKEKKIRLGPSRPFLGVGQKMDCRFIYNSSILRFWLKQFFFQKVIVLEETQRHALENCQNWQKSAFFDLTTPGSTAWKNGGYIHNLFPFLPRLGSWTPSNPSPA